MMEPTRGPRLAIIAGLLAGTVGISTMLDAAVYV
jgi:hypothetical protein